MNSTNRTLSSNCDKNQFSSNNQNKTSLSLLINNDLRPILIGQLIPFNNLVKNDQRSYLNSFRIKLAHNQSLRDFVSGLTGGLLATTTLHPLDVLKIRLAVNDGRSSTKRAYLGLRNAFKTIWVEEGIRGYYRGLVPNSLGAGLSWGLYFLFYNAIRKSQNENKNKTILFVPQSMIAAAEAGALTLLLTNPIWVVKTRLCLQYGSNLTSLTNKLPPEKQYSGMIDAFSKTYRIEGIKGLYSGFVPGLLNVTHGAIQFSIYEGLKNLQKKKNNYDSDSQISLKYIFYFSVASKVCAASLTYPLQVIRARLQDQHGNYKNFTDVWKTTWRTHGIAGFYAGACAQLLHCVPSIFIVLSIHELFLTSCQ